MHMKQKSVYQQTQALLCKNFLQKWRMKRESLLEWALPILLGLYMGLFSHFRENMYFPGLPPQDLGRADNVNNSLALVYTPISDLTQQIMNKTTFALLKERRIIGVPNQKSMDKILLDNITGIAGIVFNDTFSYKLKFFPGYYIPFLKEDLFAAHCWNMDDGHSCSLSKYWSSGFVALQAAINAAIIQIATNHSVVEELMSLTAVNMKTLPFIYKGVLQKELFIFYCLLYFFPFIYFVSLNVTKERKKCKEFMKMMGLQESAFWLSCGLIYAGFTFIISMMITVIITSTQIIVMTGFTVIFTLFFLYGLSLITLTFLMSVLLKKTLLTNLALFLLDAFCGGVGFAVYYRQLPSSLEWIFSICSPFAFTAGMSKIIYLDNTMNGIIFPDPSGDSYVMIATFSILAFDALFYLALALYFDKILPYGDERHYSPLFFLNSSCFQHQRTNNKVIEKEIDPEHPSEDYFEPVAPEFQGKEAIRIRNVQKEYTGKSGKMEALKDLLFDIYEGQITAVLGHSGAGKSSLLNILNGSSVPTEGSVTIYNKNLSEMQDLEEIKRITGVCPQFNVQFEVLTVKENLRLFAKIKGIQPQEVEQEVQRILLELDIQNIQDNLAKHLSEGQKRKLTFGIAILGDPQILLLDEPTAGLDPFSRHRVWSFLKERKAGRVILLSTNLMDEADILADRKVIMSNGRLKCAGSSVFLKRKWGLGYHLSLYRNEVCDPEKITSFINHYIPDAKLKTENKEKLVYTLPMERTNKFPDLFSDLDKCSGQGVTSYDISMSTLNDVFMKLEGKSTMEQDFEQAEIRDTESLHEIEPACSSFPEMQKAVSDMGLWKMQVCTIARLRFLKLKRGRRELLILLLVFGIAIFPLIVEKILYALLIQKSDWEFKTELYFLSPGQPPEDPRTSLLVVNNTESNIEDFIQSVKHQNILLEVDDFANRNGTDDLSYNGAIIVSGKQKDYRFSVACNTLRLHCFPILVNIISNGLLRMFNGTQNIRIERSPYPFNYVFFWMGLPEASMFLFWIVCSFSPYISMGSISDYKKRTKSQLWISGLFPSAYWCGQALVDISFFIFLLLSMYLIFYIANITEINITSRIVFGLIVFGLGYAASLVFLTYVISFIFRKWKKNSGLWSFCFYITSIIMFDIMLIHFNLPTLISSMVLVPSATMGGFLAFLAQRAYEHQRKYPDHRYDPSGVDLLVCLIPYLQALIFVFILRCMETKCGKKIMRKDPVFRISPQCRGSRPNPEETVDEDEDVKAERQRAATALSTSHADEKPVIIASCLHKVYAGQKKSCFSKRKKKIATKNISFCVKKGEILGLLGPNGAGKSSSIRMISGITKPTAGEVELKGCGSVWGHQGDNTVNFPGYCPQENVLWPILTVREHLEVFAAIKGLRKEDATIAISRLVDTFKLHKQLNVRVQKLPEGATRKLCFVLSILGNSPVLLLDEPSTGMDPAGQQQMWQMIQASIKNTEKGVLLTTHYLAEAEAVCDRIAIMVSGRLRCIGSIQHLKNKLGKDYILELRVKEASQVTWVHAEILKLFPQAAQQERYSTFLVYKLPLADVYPLSQTFRKLEAVKHNFNLEEYSLSQCTLEKVFLELSKEQELGNFEEEIDTTMRWELLSPSDDF
ncbi:ATP-binding cassette sub-family A member 6 isoform X1 [Ursus maritimus]|uniref:ATP-binding cassette sub-family A member 6 isoform X1 n=2 Tax=Ursus maritimus TaxID=29073 RepID=A0A8M1GKN7_URSMA|nr:ATP-binding cassette sub-family A member 6 isoform X1 [Ursus maritimus]XP_040496257.1 ATP-binding cassette sub-family A member 6 isoform X1 [Ursus maritimus]